MTAISTARAGLAKQLAHANACPVGASVFAYHVHDPELYGVVAFDAQRRAIRDHGPWLRLARHRHARQPARGRQFYRHRSKSARACKWPALRKLPLPKAGLQPPTVAVQGDCVMLTFRLAQRLGNTASKALVIGSEKSSEKSSEKVLNLLQAQPQLSAKTLADQLGISSRAVEKQIDLLKKSGRLQRIGPAKGGYWKVLSNE